MPVSEPEGAAPPALQADPVEAAHLDRFSDHAISLTARWLFDALHERKIHFDDFSSTDGAFSMLLGLFLERHDARGVAADRTIDFADVPLSSAVYVLRVLVEGGWVKQIGPAGQERYRLSLRAEDAMHRYIDAVRDAGRHLA